MMRFLFVSLAAMLAGCTTAKAVDHLAGTRMTPYRSIPTYIECGDCQSTTYIPPSPERGGTGN